ncbi:MULTISPECIES: VanW family protein [unclassified Paenibacillus]|uniref:VanW family protein n=1 Tax=unclassified Paenibacillus TaxID=185978 RepID=UPI001AEADCE6|nr:MULTISPECIES: VanW family protein [unclassified Paenibacillus]MBP1157772.1 vancomycin resistance protein YoaR [Paenibacillus sp. PvP091]MBP1171492.1 vancomycin resistance protein YoaR [Paenibacillus sp. PvR098]MBP2442520.1 vancomycin resistance protein YoaR [Paenibacillus sp. PvP052]
MAYSNPRLLWLWISVLMISLSACLTIAGYGSLQRIPAHVRVGDWVIGGLTVPEFEKQLEERRAGLLGFNIRLNVEGGSLSAVRTLQQLGLEVNTQELLERLGPLTDGSPFHRALYRWRIRHESWTLTARFPEEKVHEALKETFHEVYSRQPADARRVIEPDDTIRLIPEIRVQRIDEEKLKKLLEKILPSWETICGPDNQPLQLDVPMRIAEPQVTMLMLQEQGIVRKISEFITNYPPHASSAPSGEGRVHNVRSTAASLQDVLLKPGEVFDYAPFIEQTEKRFGFKEAPVIVNGKLVPGIGGGICQVSSTLYNAVLRAGLTIVERRNHSLPVSYVPLGQDATFASGHINFKFRNSTDYAVLIRTEADHQSLTVRLFGQTPPEFTYEVESRTVETLEPPVKYVLNPSLKTGKQETISKGKPGYIVETYRYKKKAGRVLSQEKLSRDTYAAQPTIIASNSGSGRGDRSIPSPSGDKPEPLIEDGVKGPHFQ